MRHPRSVALLLLGLLALPGIASGAPPPPTAASCRAFTQAFYDWYSGQARRGRGPSAADVALKLRRSAFSAALRRALAEDAAAAAKAPGKIVGLDFDPFLNAQDVADRYAVARVAPRGAGFLVDVHGVWKGKRSPTPEVQPEVQRIGGRWTFVNFHYPPHAKGDMPDNLLNVLRVLRAERKKGGR